MHDGQSLHMQLGRTLATAEIQKLVGWRWEVLVGLQDGENFITIDARKTLKTIHSILPFS